MKEEDYLLLQYLLTKYRVFCLKNYADIKKPAKQRNGYILQVRHIDYLRDRIEVVEEVKEDA